LAGAATVTHKHGKRDRNHMQIKQDLIDAGCSVCDLADLGEGRPDILVGFRGQTFGPYEIKMPGGELSPDEAIWWFGWRGGGKVIYRAEDVLCDIGVTIRQTDN
jgi:hypothetical protein